MSVCTGGFVAARFNRASATSYYDMFDIAATFSDLWLLFRTIWRAVEIYWSLRWRIVVEIGKEGEHKGEEGVKKGGECEQEEFR